MNPPNYSESLSILHHDFSAIYLILIVLMAAQSIIYDGMSIMIGKLIFSLNQFGLD